jgi:hypothetical protein
MSPKTRAVPAYLADHPRSVYVREDAIVSAVDAWLPTLSPTPSGPPARCGIPQGGLACRCSTSMTLTPDRHHVDDERAVSHSGISVLDHPQ